MFDHGKTRENSPKKSRKNPKNTLNYGLKKRNPTKVDSKNKI